MVLSVSLKRPLRLIKEWFRRIWLTRKVIYNIIVTNIGSGLENIYQTIYNRFILNGYMDFNEA